MHCPKCKAKLKITKPEMVGQRMPCPKCQAKIDVVTPDEDGHVAYDVIAIDHKHFAKVADQKEEEEEAERELLRIAARKKLKNDSIKWALSLVFYISCVVFVVWAWWFYVIKDYNDPARIAAREKRASDNAAKSIISTE